MNEMLASNLAELFQAAASLVVAVIAIKALGTWKKQLKAQKNIDFFDEYMDSIHEFVDRMALSIQMVEHIKMNIDCYSGVKELDTELSDLDNPEIVAYIKKSGKSDAKMLSDRLNACMPSLTKMRSLTAKGQVLGLKDFQKCYDSCEMFVWLHTRIEAICIYIGHESLNWRNPYVQVRLKATMEVNPEEIKKILRENYVKSFTFVRENLQIIYK